MLYAYDTADTGGVVIPLAISAGCLVIILISVVVRHRKRRRVDGAGGGPDESAAATALSAWQGTHGHDVDDWLDAHEGSLQSLIPGADPAIDVGLDRAMASAAEQCPDPDVSAMLAGMRRSANATREALVGSDRAEAEAAHEEYARLRADAITAMAEGDAAAP